MKASIYKNIIENYISFIKSNSINPNVLLIFISSSALFNFASNTENLNTTNNNSQNEIVTSHYGYLKLKIETDELSYNTEFYFNSNATTGLDPGYDATVFGGSPPSYAIYSHLVENNTGTAFAVQALSNTDMSDVTVSLGINATQGQDVSFSISETDIPENISIYLEDTVTNITTKLNSQNYNFIADSNLSGTGRFYLIFQADTALNTSDKTIKDLSVYSDSKSNTLVIKGDLDSDTEFRLYNINGSIVNYKVLETGNTNQKIDTSNLSTGVYVVKLVNKKGEIRVQKLII
jgi:hypothetical protein